LAALAAREATPSQLATLQSGIGNADLTEAGVTELRSVLIATGARDAVEKRIHEQAALAEELLAPAPIAPAALQALTDLAHAAAHRTS
jgi:geranylgeranyl diphosphate synthase type I